MERVFTYQLDEVLYINLTNRCTNACTFCIRNEYDGLNGQTLWLEKEPNAKEIIAEIKDPKAYPEIVFCGYGEPTERLEVLKEVARYIKDKGGITRLNTNGHGSIINNRDIVPELEGLIDVVSVSLNAGTQKEYDRLSRPVFPNALFAVQDFIKKSAKTFRKTIATVVAIPGEDQDIEAARRLAESLGAEFRVRIYE